MKIFLFFSLIKFQKYGNQNNIWNEAHFSIEEFHEDFQIVFVAKSGRGQLSDIAVDDVKLLTDNDCRALGSKDDEDFSNEEYYSTTYESLFEMQSCVGHCLESPGSGLIRTSGHHLKGLCNCDIDCEDNETCCPDFRSVCLNEIFSQSTPLSETDEETMTHEAYKNDSTITTASTIIKTTVRKTTTNDTPATIIDTTKTTPTTNKTTPATTKITLTTTRTTPTTTKIIPTTTKTALSTKSSTTTISTTLQPLIIKSIKTTVNRLPTPTTRTPETTPATTTRKTTLKTTLKTKLTITTRKTTTTKKITTKIIQTTPTTYLAPTSTTKTHASTISIRGSSDRTSRRPIPVSNPIEYIIDDKSKVEAESKGHSSLLLYIFFIAVALIIAGVAYKHFGTRAAAWYMIRFKLNTTGDADSSTIRASFKQPQAKTRGTNGNARPTWRNIIKKSTNTKNMMKTPLVNRNDEDDDDYIGANGNISLKNNIYTEF